MTALAALAPVLATFVAMLGLAVGSFLNVVAYRVPLGLSVVSPPSACPGCSTEIRARDNVPVLSWLALRGRCRDCAEPISVRYPIVELITGVLFIAVAVAFLPPILSAPDAATAVAGALVLVAFLTLAALSVALTAIDLDVQRLPDRLVIPGYVVGGLLLPTSALLTGDLESAARAAAGSGILVAFFFALVLIKPGGMGLGDVKLAGVLGLFLGFLGWPQLIVGVAAAFILGGIVGIVLLATKRATRSTGIPFGPWMFAGTWIAVFAADPIVTSYLSIVGLA